PCALFAENDGTFLVHLVGLEEEGAGEIGKDLQSLGHGGGLGIGQLDLEGGVVEGGVGIGVAAEAHAEVLKILDQGAGCVMGAAVEAHVLEKMGEAALVFGFVER